MSANIVESRKTSENRNAVPLKSVTGLTRMTQDTSRNWDRLLLFGRLVAVVVVVVVVVAVAVVVVVVVRVVLVVVVLVVVVVVAVAVAVAVAVVVVVVVLLLLLLLTLSLSWSLWFLLLLLWIFVVASDGDSVDGDPIWRTSRGSLILVDPIMNLHQVLAQNRLCVHDFCSMPTVVTQTTWMV